MWQHALRPTAISGEVNASDTRNPCYWSVVPPQPGKATFHDLCQTRDLERSLSPLEDSWLPSLVLLQGSRRLAAFVAGIGYYRPNPRKNALLIRGVGAEKIHVSLCI